MNEQPIVLEDYAINKRTLALLSAAHIDYQTIVLEGNNIFYIRKRPMELIKSACYKGGASYEGRREATIHETTAKKKVPIAINTNENIFVFPTLSPNNFHCNWIFYHHVLHVIPIPKIPNQCTIIFNNRKQITLNVSSEVIEKQMNRTHTCTKYFSLTKTTYR
ncbi:competence protein ComK [Evansella sp. AB-rgal1]|uniref:competence protein ComK n=1 Tax=Evansella sp. AB-rgal1 TaxID=3242696 RepID=UPI00359EB8FE